MKTQNTQKSRIDELVAKKEELLFLKERKSNQIHEANSKLGTKIKKLENKSYRNKVVLDDFKADIDRQVRKINALIELEREYVNTLADQEKNTSRLNENSETQSEE
ncbi:MAG: hypothetical protein IJX25_00140 [Clostridia bacterium]|nr:hypothetical protein [Clostridia bacterium]